jgi:putative addiction module component (TIGR02574 family)
MTFDAVLAAIQAMDIDDRVRLVAAIQESIDAEQDSFELTAKQKREIDRRIAEHEADPSSAIPWEKVSARLRAAGH